MQTIQHQFNHLWHGIVSQASSARDGISSQASSMRDGISSRISSMWQWTKESINSQSSMRKGISSQASSMWQWTRNTIKDKYNSVEFYTALLAEYILLKGSRTPERRKVVLLNVVLPLSIAVGVTACIKPKAALCLTVAAAVYTAAIAKKKAYW